MTLGLRVDKTHPHTEKCDEFRDALKFETILVIEGEPQIVGKLPDGATAGNVLTGETYDPKTFCLNMVIQFCPFCGKRIHTPKTEGDDE